MVGHCALYTRHYLWLDTGHYTLDTIYGWTLDTIHLTLSMVGHCTLWTQHHPLLGTTHSTLQTTHGRTLHKKCTCTVNLVICTVCTTPQQTATLLSPKPNKNVKPFIAVKSLIIPISAGRDLTEPWCIITRALSEVSYKRPTFRSSLYNKPTFGKQTQPKTTGTEKPLVIDGRNQASNSVPICKTAH